MNNNHTAGISASLVQWARWTSEVHKPVYMTKCKLAAEFWLRCLPANSVHNFTNHKARREQSDLVHPFFDQCVEETVKAQ